MKSKPIFPRQVSLTFSMINLLCAVLAALWIVFDQAQTQTPKEHNELLGLFICFVFLPLSFFFYSKLTLPRRLIRTLAVMFLSLWLVLYLVPEQQHDMLAQLKPYRYLGLVLIFLIELRFLLIIMDSVFKRDETQEALSERLVEAGEFPLWYARVMAAEAAFWRKLFKLFKR